MKCPQCGLENPPTANVCECGYNFPEGKISNSRVDPDVEDNAATPTADSTVPALWNPNAVGIWSLVFTPVFMSILVFLNWKALGEPKKASTALLFLFMAIALLFVIPFIPSSFQVSPEYIVLVFLVSWYGSVCYPQVQYVKIKFGNQYSRRSWAKPLLIGVVGWVGYLVLVVILSLVLDLIGLGQL